MTDWQKKVDEALLGGMRYCFTPTNGKYPEIDMEEYHGPPDMPGFRDFMLSLVDDLRKEAFFKGYELSMKDSVDICKDHITSGDSMFKALAFDIELSKVWASKAWDKWEEK